MLRHRREATKLRPRCLSDVDSDNNGEPLMKKLLIGTAALMAFAAPALAADLPARTYSKAPVYTPPQAIYNWTGFYIGGHVGGAFAGDNSLQGNSARFLGGSEITFHEFAAQMQSLRVDLVGAV